MSKSVPYHTDLIERLRDEQYYDMFIKQIQNDAVEPIQSQLTSAIEVIRFYADEMNMDYAGVFGESYKVEHPDGYPTYGWKSDNGKRAREFLSQLESDAKDGG